MITMDMVAPFVLFVAVVAAFFIPFSLFVLHHERKNLGVDSRPYKIVDMQIESRKKRLLG